ncbi:MAG TPA: DUF4245 family protein [Mycobacteriales bacterium]|nr:DUF4245 family protein [Mycobacteriales bacterium]
MSGTRRGRETALDMVRTLAVVFALVLPLWFFGRSSPGDAKRIRPVDPRDAYAAFVADTHAAVPASTPAGWTCTVRAYDPGGVLRVGYVNDDAYVEFSGARGTSFLAEATGQADPVGTVAVDGTPWQDYRSAQGQQSLVLTRAGVTVLVGGERETATQEQLVAFARTVRPG